MEITHGRFKITVDELQYTLYIKFTGKRKKTEEEYEDYREIGYYSSFEAMLNRMVKLEMLAKHDKEVFTLQEFIAKYQEVMDIFKKEIVEPLNIK